MANTMAGVPDGVAPTEVLGWSVGLRLHEHKNGDVREAAKGLAVALFRAAGPGIRSRLGHLRGPQVEEYEEAFAKIQTRATHVIHWYASVSELQSLAAAHLRNRDRSRRPSQHGLTSPHPPIAHQASNPKTHNFQDLLEDLGQQLQTLHRACPPYLLLRQY